MKKTKFFKSVLALLLAVLLAVPNMTSAFAATRLFVKDLKIVYASSPEEARKKLGSEYTLVQRSEKDKQGKLKKYDCSLTEGSYDSNPNSGNGTQNVYLAYSTTTEATEAITDISAMFMSGEFDTSSYDDILENFNKSVQSEVEKLKILIKEYRENYNSEEKNKDVNGKAHAAYTYLSLYYDEDCLYDEYKDMDEDELSDVADLVKYMSIADIFLDEKICTDSYLTKFYVESNTSVVISIEQAISVAQGGKTSWIERLSKTNYDELFNKYKEKDVQHNSKEAVNAAIQKAYFNSFTDLCNAWYDLDKGFEEYENSGLSVIISTEEEITAKYPDEKEKIEFMRYGLACEELKKVSYDNSNMYDAIFNHPVSYLEKNPNNYFVLLSVLTIGELTSLKDSDVISFITKGLNKQDDYSKAIEVTDECFNGEMKISGTSSLDYSKDKGEFSLDMEIQVTQEDEKIEKHEADEGYDTIATDVTEVIIEPISIYLGVDREFFKSGIALTKQAIKDMTTKGKSPLENNENETEDDLKNIITASVAGIASAAALAYTTRAAIKYVSVVKIFENSASLREMGVTLDSFPRALSSTVRRLDDCAVKIRAANRSVRTYANAWNVKPLSQAERISNANKVFEANVAGKFTNENKLEILNSYKGKAAEAEFSKIKMGFGAAFTVIFAGIMIASLVSEFGNSSDIGERIEQRENAKYEYPIDIPERMCWAKDTIETLDGKETDTEVEGETVTVTDFFFYNAVKNTDGICADIFAKTQKQWVTLYTTNDWGCGYPILADSLTIKTGSATQSNSYEKAVHIFGQKSSYAQNLHDSSDLKLTEADDTKGFYIFYNCYKPLWEDWTGGSSFADVLPVIICVFCACGITAAGVVVVIKKKKKKANAQ